MKIKSILLHLRHKNEQDALFYFQFISVINLYMFRAGLLLIIRRYFSVLFVQQLLFVMRLCFLAASRIGVEILNLYIVTLYDGSFCRI
jgi:hypothetical protein